jgi:hypothetical protein
MDEDHKGNFGILINFNYSQFILIKKYRVHTQYDILIYYRLQQFWRHRRHLVMAVYGRNTYFEEEGSLLISCDGDGNILYEINEYTERRPSNNEYKKKKCHERLQA